MTTVTVNSNAGLLSALKTAQSGDTIQLAAGTYSSLLLYQVHPAGMVTITSASQTNQAVLTDLDVNQSSNLRFTNLTFATTLYNAPTSTEATTPFVVYSSSNIAFDRLNVHGTLDNNDQNDVNGIRLQGDSGVSITNSSFQQLYNAVTDLSNTNVRISNNTFHDIRNDGIDNGGTSNVIISDNTFTNFHPVGAVGTTGDHADAIQFWTSNTTTDASNIAVENNTFVRGDGSYIQGVFITDQVGLGYNNVTVTGNTLIGAEYNAIDVESSHGVNVSNNLVEGYAGMPNYIRLANDTGVTLNNNIAPGLQILSGVSFVSQLANQITGIVSPIASLASLASFTPVTAVAQVGKVDAYGAISGNLLAGATGSSLYVADVGVGAATQTAMSTATQSYTGSYGTLTVNANGSYAYTETKNTVVVGQTYDDHFTMTVASPTGGAQSTTLDVYVTPSGVGDGRADTIHAGAGAETISGFGAGSALWSGTGADRFVFSNLAQSTPTTQTVIAGFKAGDTIDISAIDPNFHLVSHFDGHANEVEIVHLGTGNWEIYGDTTGSGTANMAIHLMSVATTYNISANDLHF